MGKIATDLCDKVIFTSDNSWNELQGNIDLRDDQWHHVAATYDGTVAKLYIDGELDNEIYFNTDYLSTLDGGNYSTNIGTANHASEYFNGIIDDLAIWNRALTEQQIQAQMNAPLLGNELGLAAYWNFNEGQGNSLTDLSGNGNDGAINGATWSDDVPSLENDSDYAIGSLGPAGGFIIHDKGLVSDGWRYIEIAPDGWSGNGDPTTTWGCSGSEINGADGYALGSGMQNLSLIHI